jgi:hypothetical protein
LLSGLVTKRLGAHCILAAGGLDLEFDRECRTESSQRGESLNRGCDVGA